jgi:hypothetical protein
MQKYLNSKLLSLNSYKVELLFILIIFSIFKYLIFVFLPLLLIFLIGYSVK